MVLCFHTPGSACTPARCEKHAVRVGAVLQNRPNGDAGTRSSPPPRGTFAPDDATSVKNIAAAAAVTSTNFTYPSLIDCGGVWDSSRRIATYASSASNRPSSDS